MHHPADRITHITAFVTPIVDSSMGPPHEGSIRRPTTPRANTLSYVRLPISRQIRRTTYYHFHDHVEFGPQPAVGGVELHDAQEEDDDVHAVHGLRLDVVAGVEPHREAGEHQDQVEEVEAVEEAVPVPYLALHRRVRKRQELQ